MIGQITPLVQAAKGTWWRATAGHIAGAALTAGALGGALGSVGLVLDVERWGPPIGLLGGALFLACALRDAGVARWPLPALRRQTPNWFTCAYGPTGGAFMWGADLGLGWTTLVIFSGYYGLAGWAVLGASPAMGALALGAYGLGRGLPVLLAGLGPSRKAVAGRSVVYVLRLPMLQQVNAAALAFIAGYLLSTAARG